MTGLGAEDRALIELPPASRAEEDMEEEDVWMLLHALSSDPSLQSSCPSHSQMPGMQIPESHLKSP